MNMGILVVGMLWFLIFTTVVVAAPMVQVTVKVIDQESQSIEGATIQLTLIQSLPESVGAGTEVIEGMTDQDGMYTGFGESEWIGVSVAASKEGYYTSGDGIPIETVNTLLNRWEPWNPTITLRLKKIRNPVPMYYKQTDWMKVPVFDRPVGYDLLQGDWVAPYGKGMVKDFIFTMTCRFESMTNAEARYVLTFSNPGDGIQIFVPDSQEQSRFKWPFSAPSDGYESQIEKEEAYLPREGQKTNTVNDIHYIFRVRTGQKVGTITGPLYGKIRGEIDISRDGYIKFTYRLNPDGTPNLEEDPRRNLFDEVRPPSKTLRQIILEREKQQESSTP